MLIRIGVANLVRDTNRIRIAMPGKAASSSGGVGDAIPTGVVHRLLANAKTKQSIQEVLAILSEANLIKDIADDRGANLKRKLADTIEKRANVKTPYGPLIKSLEINTSKVKHWEYINPFAWLWYVSTISGAFADMMRSCTVDGN